jgi:hypothetical protein
MKKRDIPKAIYIAHAPADSHFASALAEGVKEHGLEVGRTVQRRGRADDPALAEKFRKRAQPYLDELRGPRPMEMDFSVFLSYAREDFDDVFRFHLRLLEMGMVTFLDRSVATGVPFGKDWVDGILEKLTTCCSMAFFLSPHSIQSEFVSYEVRFFIERMKVRSGAFLATILLEKMDAEALRNHGAVVIDFYRMSAKDAADQYIRELLKFCDKENGPSGTRSRRESVDEMEESSGG